MDKLFQFPETGSNTILIEKKGATDSRSQSGKSSNNFHNQKGYATFINNVYNSYADKFAVGESSDGKSR